MNEINLTKIQTEYRLNEAQKKLLKNLLNSCNKEETLSLSLDPEDENALYLLGFSSDRLICAAALFEIEENRFEYTAFTDPSYRKNGCFKLLWKKLLACPGLQQKRKISIDILSASSCSAGAAAASSLGASLFRIEHYLSLNAEYQKELSSTARTPSAAPPKNEKNSSAPGEKKSIFSVDSLRLEGSGNGSYEIYCDPYSSRTRRQRRLLASFSLLEIRYKKTAYFYGFKIFPPYRGRGLGGAVFAFIKKFLLDSGYERIEIQVAGSNTAAIKIYRNAGFQIEYSLFYHRIHINTGILS